MSESHSTVDDSLPQSVMEQVDSVCDRFEDAWLAGQRPRIEDFLAEVSDERVRQALVKELIALDIYHRQKLDETILPRDYERFFPVSADYLAGMLNKDASSVVRYQFGNQIGIGGMGKVLRGRDLHLRRDLAIKMLREEHQGQAHLHRRFLEEARIGGRLQHPGIVPVHDLGELSDGRPFFTMKLVEGRTLEALLEERAEPSHDLPRFLTIFEQICQTLAYAHAQGVIHRDLKPGNVMVGAFGEVQVMDWGLAKVLKRSSVAEATAGGDTVVYGPVEEDTSAQAPTQPGQAMGSYPYMPPEQARGEIERVDERSDVFGLGAILCEILTGQPPFTSRDKSEIFAKVKACDHAEAMAQLDACGADAELLQLARTCLAAKPEDRPRNAGVVAESMKSYLTGVQERLRAAERERAAAQARAEEARRTVAAEQRARRRMVGAALAMMLLIVGTGSGALWYQQQVAARREEAAKREAQLREAVAAALDKVADLRQRAHWGGARAVLEQVRRRLGSSGPEDLQRQVEQAEADLTLVDRLEAQRLKASVLLDGHFDQSSAAREYATAFREAGLGDETEAAEVVAARIRSSVVREQLVAAVDHWALRVGKKEPARLAWLLAVARAADPDPWRDRFREPSVWQDRWSLERLAREARVSELSPHFLHALGYVLYHSGADAVPLLMAAQRRYPSDFWLNFDLGCALGKAERWEEAIGYVRAALALRPATSAVHNNLGAFLANKGRLDEAIAELRKAIALDPRDPLARTNLGIALKKKGHVDEAIAGYRKALELDPNLAYAHLTLGTALRDKGRLYEAITEWEKVIELDPNFAAAYYNLGIALKDQGKLVEAEAAYRKAIALKPDCAEAHCNLGAVLRSHGRFTESLMEYRCGHELGSKQFDWNYNSLQWVCEAERLVDLEQQLSALLSGEKKPANVHDLMTVARMATHHHQQFLATTRLLGQSFATHPDWAERLPTDPPRYYAACCAAMAAAGKGFGADALDAAERRKLRQQAVSWLRDELDRNREQLTNGTPADRAAVARALAYWKADGWLAAVRNKDAVDKLPQDERDACRKLWADVADLLRSIRDKLPNA